MGAKENSIEEGITDNTDNLLYDFLLAKSYFASKNEEWSSTTAQTDYTDDK